MVLVARHILGTQLLDSPYKIIAADVNRSNTVSTADLVDMRKLILQYEGSFPDNTSWRFIDASYICDRRIRSKVALSRGDPL